jgi:hypothetical protein
LNGHAQGSKGKERAIDNEDGDPFANDEEPSTPTTADALTYPPINDDDEETRRVEEVC